MPNTDAMNDDLRGAAQAANHAERAGFCQECGRVLTSATLRHVGSGTFCVDCGAQASDPHGWRSVYAGSPGVRPNQGQSARTGGTPRPRLAAWLGFMPGVGAMYNGQYGKGAMHLAVFVALLAMADHVSDVLYWLVWGWVFYQAFDAYHTARARRDGQPLPDPFGFNDVGGRFFSGNPGKSASFNAAPQPPPYRNAPPEQGTAPNTSAPPRPYAWNGENPYEAPYAAPVSPSSYSGSTSSASFVGQAHRVSDLNGVPTSPMVMPTPLEGTRRFPVAALWLVGLGLVFLLGNMLPSWHLSGEWVAILAVAVLTVWSAAHRWLRSRSITTANLDGRRLLSILGFPAVLSLSCVLLVLDALHIASIARSWPLVLVFWGIVLFAQRSLPTAASASYPGSSAVKSAIQMPSAYEDEEASLGRDRRWR